MAFDGSDEKKDVSLRNDFDTVVRYGETTVELNANGSVVVNTKGRTITCDDNNVTIRLPANDTGTSQKIINLAAEEARRFGHATITFDHLVAAVLKTSPRQIDGVFNPKIKCSTLLNLIEKDLGSTANHPQTLLPGSKFNFSEAASAALNQTKDAVKKWNSDRLFGLELLHSMIKIRKETRSERSNTLEYIVMIASCHASLDPATELRAMIDKYANASGDVPVRVIRHELGHP